MIRSMLIHSLSVYSCRVSILKTLEHWIKKFILNGDISKKKLFTELLGKRFLHLLKDVWELDLLYVSMKMLTSSNVGT